MIDLDRYRSPTRDAVAWNAGDLAVNPHFGIVRVAALKRVDDTMFMSFEPILVVRPLVTPLIPVYAAANHVVPLVDRTDAAQLVALLAEPTRDRPPGDAVARRTRCERVLTFGELPRLRRALHQLYSEPHRPAPDDLRILGELEQIVLGELSYALDQPFDALRARLRATHTRFGDDAPALREEPTGETRFVVRDRKVRAWGGYRDFVEIDVVPGVWLCVEGVPGYDEFGGVAIHESQRAKLDEWLAKATPAGSSNSEGATAFIEDAALVDDPALVCEHFDPVDATIYGAGTWWRMGGDGTFEIRAAYDDRGAVLIAVPAYGDEGEDEDEDEDEDD